MADEKKSYLVNMQFSIVTDNGEKVKAIHIHQMNNEPVPLQLWCDFLGRLSSMLPDESVLFVGGGCKEIEPLVEKGKAYLITKNIDDFITNDYFEGISSIELKHCRSGQVVRVDQEKIKNFVCVGDYDARLAAPISEETLEMLERTKKFLYGNEGSNQQ